MSAGDDGGEAPKAISRCPICRKPSLEAHRPFCSKRCAQLDLGRWLKGSYVVTADPSEEAYPEPPADWEKE